MWNKPVLNSYPCRSPINKTWLTDCPVEQHLGESKTVTRQVALAYQVVHHILGGCGWCRLRKQTSWEVNTTTMHVLYLLCAVHFFFFFYIYNCVFLVHLKRKQKKKKQDAWMSEREECCNDGWMFLNKCPAMMCLAFWYVWYSSTSRLDGDACDNKHHQRLTTSQHWQQI